MSRPVSPNLPLALAQHAAALALAIEDGHKHSGPLWDELHTTLAVLGQQLAIAREIHQLACV